VQIGFGSFSQNLTRLNPTPHGGFASRNSALRPLALVCRNSAATPQASRGGLASPKLAAGRSMKSRRRVSAEAQDMPLQPFHVPGVRVWNGGTTACILTAPRPARAAAWRAHRGKAGRLPVAHLLVRLGARALARRVHLRRLGEVAKTPRSCPGRAPTPPASLVLYLRVPNKTTREPGGDRRPSLRPAAPGRRSLRSDQRATKQRRSWGQSEVDQSINSMPAPDRATPRTGCSRGRRRAFHKARATKSFCNAAAGINTVRCGTDGD
jgi:hypothetical protein